ncbi:MAG TPA: GNAT family N-acetyltransferase [Pyrinomonadaceae bacterium]|nr:GNAT family N-acetyltransferase [Pyrinomonadaceae bacterium]
MDYQLRKATLNDRSAIQKLIAESARELSTEDYTATQIETAIATVFGFDSDLVIDNTYFVAERDGTLLGCGGWSRRKTLFGGDQYPGRDPGYLDPGSEPARIRAFFVHPQFARKGIARAILSACESEAKAAGFTSVELMATLPGVKLYKACGFEGDQQVECELTSGVKLQLVPMRKVL